MRFKLNALERYVLRETMTSVAAAGAIISAVVLMIQFVDLSREVASRYDVGFVQVTLLTLLRAPSTLIMLMPFMFLFGSLWAFVGLNRRSELVAMRAAGISAWRFIMPAAVAAFAVGAITVAVLSPGASQLQRRYDDARQRMENPGIETQDKGIWLRDSDGRNQIVIKARALDRRSGGLRLLDATFYIYSVSPQGGAEFQRRIDAGDAQLASHEWRLRNVRESAPDAGALTSATGSLPSSTDAAKAVEHFATPEAISFWDLPNAIRTTEQAGYTAAGYRLRQQQLIASPVLFAAMSILGAAFSLRLMRLGGLAVLATSGVALGFVFYFLNALSGAVGKADLAPLFAAAWAPPVLALLSGLTLLIYTEDG